MTGVILIIDLIHYPSFAQIDKNHFVQFHARHTSMLGFIAGPAMVLELVSAMWIAKSGDLLGLANAVAVIGLWAITFLISVPAHEKLSKGFEEHAWLRLVATNRWRTLLWLGRSLFFGLYIVRQNFI